MARRFANRILDNDVVVWNSGGVSGCAKSALERRKGPQVPFDGRPEDWEGPRCTGCRELIEAGQRTTEMHFQNDPQGELGLSGPWHSECARPYWDTVTPALEKLRRSFR